MKPVFDHHCKDFDEDKRLVVSQNIKKANTREADLKARIIGIILLSSGFILVVIGLFLGRIFIFAFLVMGYGLINIMRSNKINNRKKQAPSIKVLDADGYQNPKENKDLDF